MAWPPNDGEKFKGPARLAIVAPDGTLVATKDILRDGEYSFPEMEYNLQLKARELARGYAFLNE